MSEYDPLKWWEAYGLNEPPDMGREGYWRPYPCGCQSFVDDGPGWAQEQWMCPLHGEEMEQRLNDHG